MPDAAANSKPSTTSTSATSDNNNKPSWDSSPLTRQEWIDDLPSYLALKNPNYKTLWQMGYSLEKGSITVTSSPQHSIDIHNDNVIARDFMDVTNERYVCKAMRNPDAIPAEAAGSYKEASRALDSIDLAMLEDILDTITNARRAKSYRKKANGSGIAMIALIHSENSQKKTLTQSSYLRVPHGPSEVGAVGAAPR